MKKTTTSVSKILQNIISMLTSIVKAKSMVIRDKTRGLKARLLVLSLLRNKKFSLGYISQKIEAILNHKHGYADMAEDDHSKSIVLCNASVHSGSTATRNQYHEYDYNGYENDDDDDKYPDLRHSLFDDELDLGDPNGSVIDLVSNSKEEGEDFKLEGRD